MAITTSIKSTMVTRTNNSEMSFRGLDPVARTPKTMSWMDVILRKPSPTPENAGQQMTNGLHAYGGPTHHGLAGLTSNDTHRNPFSGSGTVAPFLSARAVQPTPADIFAASFPSSTSKGHDHPATTKRSCIKVEDTTANDSTAANEVAAILASLRGFSETPTRKRKETADVDEAQESETTPVTRPAKRARIQTMKAKDVELREIAVRKPKSCPSSRQRLNAKQMQMSRNMRPAPTARTLLPALEPSQDIKSQQSRYKDDFSMKTGPMDRFPATGSWNAINNGPSGSSSSAVSPRLQDELSIPINTIIPARGRRKARVASPLSAQVMEPELGDLSGLAARALSFMSSQAALAQPITSSAIFTCAGTARAAAAAATTASYDGDDDYEDEDMYDDEEFDPVAPVARSRKAAPKDGSAKKPRAARKRAQPKKAAAPKKGKNGGGRSAPRWNGPSLRGLCHGWLLASHETKNILEVKHMRRLAETYRIEHRLTCPPPKDQSIRSAVNVGRKEGIFKHLPLYGRSGGWRPA